MASANKKPDLAQTPAKHPEATGANRRRSVRENVFTQGLLRTIDVDELGAMFTKPVQVLVTNVSMHGVGFRSNEELDDTLLYAIEIGVGPLHLSSRMRLVRVRPLPDGTFDIGAEFC
jgi:hypothetical protein